MNVENRSCPVDPLASRPGWGLERALFAVGGTVTLLGAALSAFVSIWFLLLVAFVGVNQWLFVALGDCPMSLFLSRTFHLQRGVAR